MSLSENPMKALNSHVTLSTLICLLSPSPLGWILDRGSLGPLSDLGLSVCVWRYNTDHSNIYIYFTVGNYVSESFWVPEERKKETEGKETVNSL